MPSLIGAGSPMLKGYTKGGGFRGALGRGGSWPSTSITALNPAYPTGRGMLLPCPVMGQYWQMLGSRIGVPVHECEQCSITIPGKTPGNSARIGASVWHTIVYDESRG